MSKELKPCPFCGETSLTIEDNQMVQDVHVLCKDCGAKTSFDGIRYAVAGRWNVRPVERALKSRIEELEAENGRLRKAFPKWQSGEELPAKSDRLPESRPVKTAASGTLENTAFLRNASVTITRIPSTRKFGNVKITIEGEWCDAQ